MGQKRRHILVYQLGSIGDTVVTMPALRAVRRHYGPDVDICLLHETQAGLHVTPSDLLSGGPEIDRFISYPHATTIRGKLLTALRLWWRLKRERFRSVVYAMPGERSERQVKRDALFFRWCGIRELIGFRAFPEAVLYPAEEDGHPAPVMHEVQFRLERLQRDGIDISQEMDFSRPFLHIPPKDGAAVIQWLKRNRRHPDRMLVAICPGAKQPANLWPEDRFVEIGKRLAAKKTYEIVVVGGPAEAQCGDRMVAIWGEGLNAAGRLSVLESAALLGQCAFCIGLDTGTTHLAAALGTPCIALYGERDNAGRFEPLGKGHSILRTKVSCAGCRLIGTPCPVTGHPCMTGIEVNAVWEAVCSVAATME